jgi:tetratricopeptide (TPR) repeat protein
MRYLPILLLLAACATSAPPSVPYPIEDFYRTTYPSKPDHKAFALATGASGYASGYSYGYSDAKEAIDSAMRVCNERKATYNVNETCHLYAVDDIVVWGKSDEEMEALIKSHYRLYYNRGLAYRGKDDYDRAIKNYDEAISINPEGADAYYSRGDAYHGKGDYDQAIRDYDEAIRINPEDANAYNSRGVAYHGKGDYDQAIRDYDEAIRINPEDAIAYNNRCWTYGLMHRPDEALRDCNQSLRLRPDNVPTLDSRALAYWLRGDEDKARDDLEHASMIDSSLPAWQERFREFEEMF